MSLADCRKQVSKIGHFANKYDGYWKVIEQLEGTIRNMSQHAAGVVIAVCDLTVVEQRKRCLPFVGINMLLKIKAW